MSEYLKTLKPFCKTARQEEILAAVIETDGNMKQASLNLGINKSGAHKVVKAIRKNASKQGYAPEYDLTHPVAETQLLKGASTLYGADGEVKLQWIKSSSSAEIIAETLHTIADELKQTIIPLPASTSTPPILLNSSLLNLHVLTDMHIGMYSNKVVSGEDWSSEKSEQFIINWFKYAIDTAPPAETGVLLNLGDFFHSDSIAPVTPASKHLLDVDISYPEMVRMGTRLIKYIINLMAEKYSKVVLYNISGNHDTSSAIWLREFFSSYYELHNNIEVNTDHSLYSCYVHGDTSLFFHHGHKRKISNLHETLVSMFRKEYGQTTKSYAHIGHYHHLEIKEHPSMVVQQHRTMAPKDAYASDGGYISGRSADVITYHDEFGEISKLTVTAELVNTLMNT
jgi:hypothetical protein